MEIFKAVKKLGVVAGFGLVSLMASDGAQAAPYALVPLDAAIAVSATVEATCVIATAGGPVAFGIYDQTAGNMGVTTSVGFQCTVGMPITISADGAGGAAMVADGSATYTLVDGANTMNYDVTVTGLGPTVGLGSGATDPEVTVDLTFDLPANQTPAVGSYSDTFNVSVDY